MIDVEEKTKSARRAGLTFEEMEAVERARLRREFRERSPGERLEEVFELSEFALQVRDAGRRARHSERG